MSLTIGSLFSGVGGLELGLEWSGLGRTAWQVEQDEFCRQVLSKHWPDADRSVTDVRCAGATTLVPVDVICGGFPCQDVSGAGKGAGLDGARSGLWWEYLRIVDEMRPRLVVVENVASGAKRWLCTVRHSLHELGYRTRALGVAARDVGAPHRRERIFVVANTERVGCQRSEVARADPSDPKPKQGHPTNVGRPGRLLGAAGSGSDVGNASSEGRERAIDSRAPTQRSLPTGASGRLRETQRGLGGDPARLPAGLDRHRWPATRGEAQHDWEPSRTVTDRPPWRRQRLRALGNAVVPQCAYVVGIVARQILKQE